MNDCQILRTTTTTRVYNGHEVNSQAKTAASQKTTHYPAERQTLHKSQGTPKKLNTQIPPTTTSIRNHSSHLQPKPQQQHRERPTKCHWPTIQPIILHISVPPSQIERTHTPKNS